MFRSISYANLFCKVIAFDSEHFFHHFTQITFLVYKVYKKNVIPQSPMEKLIKFSLNTLQIYHNKCDIIMNAKFVL